MALQNLRSNTANKRPTASGMVDGQVAINTNATNPGLFFKDAGDGIRKVGPVFIGSSAPNSSPAAGGSTGHSIGEQWLDTSGSRYVVKTWDGTAWRDDDSNYLQLTGGALSGALTIDNAANVAALDLKFDGDTDTGFYSPAANTLGFVGGGTERLRIDSSGKFGFGTSTVSTAKFTFNSGGTNEVARFESTDAGAYLSLKDSTSTSINFIEGGADQLSFGTNNAERLRIDSSGKVGIGTSSPSSNGLVTIAETTNARLYLTDSTLGNTYGAQLRGYSTSGLGAFAELGVVDNNSYRTAIKITQQAESITFNTVTSERMRIDSSGRVGVGTTDVNAPLEVRNSSALQIRTSTGAGNYWEFGRDNSTGDFFLADDGLGTVVAVDQVTGNVGLGTSSPATLLHIAETTDTELRIEATGSSAGDDARVVLKTTNGSFTVQNDRSLGTSGALTFAGNTSDNIVIDHATGNVGLGTSSPNSKLEVRTPSGTDCQVRINEGGTSNPFIIEQTATESRVQVKASQPLVLGAQDTAGSSQPIVFKTRNNERMRIDSSGNVGIGNTAMSSYNGASNDLVVGNHTGAHGLTIASQSNSSGYIMFADGTSGQQQYEGQIQYNHDQNFMRALTAGNERLRIDSTGRVGIGTTSPAGDLQISGSGDRSLLITGGTSGTTSVQMGDSSDADAGAILYDNSNNSMQFKTNASERMRIDSSGRLLIGTTSPRGNFFQTTGQNWQHQIEGTSYLSSGQAQINNSPDNLGAYLNFAKSRGTSVGSNTVVQSGDDLGVIDFHGNDGTDFVHAARIVTSVDGTPGSNDMPGRLSFWTTADSATTPTERMRIDSSGNIGIGTSSPTGYIHIEGDSTGTETYGRFTTGPANGDQSLVIKSGSSRDHMAIQVSTNAGANDDLALQPDGGNVGIGVINPGDFNAKAETLVLANGGDDVGITLDCDTDKEGSIYFADGSSGDNLARGQIVYNHDGDSLRFVTNASERMRINSSGNVGIGTSSPAAKLDVAGNQLFSAANPQIQFNAGGPIIRLPSANTLAFLTDSSNERMRIDSSGNVGIGTSQPSFTEGSGLRVERDTTATIRLQDTGHHGFEISASSDDAKFRTMNNKPFVFANGSDNELMRIDSSDLVKITGSNEQSMFHLSTGNSAGHTFAGMRGDNEAGIRIVGGGSFPGGGIELGGGLRNSNPGIIRFYSGTAGSVTQRMTLNNSGDFFVTKTSDSSTAVGHSLNADGLARHVRNGGTVMAISRGSSDGTLVVFQRAGTSKGTISVSGNTVTYGAFCGTHWGRLGDSSKPEILPGTILETINQAVEWKVIEFTVDGEQKRQAYNGPEENGTSVTVEYEGVSYTGTVADEEPDSEDLNKHVCVKVSDTSASKAVFGVFLGWDDQEDQEANNGVLGAWNDMNIAAVGNYFIRIKSGQSLEIGDLIESDGTGCGVVQSDDIIRSKTVGKVTSTTPQQTYADGSFLVTCVLYSG